MKKLLIATNILLLTVILFQAHNQPKTAQITTNNCTQQMCKSYQNKTLPGQVSGYFLQYMSQAYANDPNKANITGSFLPATRQPIKDGLSVCFTLDQIKNFIWQIEYDACRSGCSNFDSLGVRFYFIKYKKPSNNDPHKDEINADLKTILNKCPSCIDKHSIAMEPVVRKNGVYYDFDYQISHADSANHKYCFPTLPHIDLIKAKSMISAMPDGDNHGGIGPPPDPGTYPNKPTTITLSLNYVLVNDYPKCF